MPPQDSRQRTRQFFLGLGTGLIPAIVFLVTFGLSASGFGLASSSGSGPSAQLQILSIGLISSPIMYLAAFVAMIVCLAVARVRFIGYGLLAAVVSGPVISGIACTVVANLHA